MSEEQEFNSLADRLGSAFNEQADRFEPSDNAYARVAEAVTQAQEPPRSIGWLRPLAAAAAVVACVGLGGLVLSAQGSQSVGTGPGDGDQSAASVLEGSTSTTALLRVTPRRKTTMMHSPMIHSPRIQRPVMPETMHRSRTRLLPRSPDRFGPPD